MEGFNKKIVLEDGEEYLGYGFGADKETVCEIVFNTSVVGYQEIVSDPSYTYQAVVMTYPLIGNYAGFRECHIKPDWILIYLVDEDELELLLFRNGTHSDLF